MITQEIPVDVSERPSGPDGNGFMFGDIYADSVVGSDGEVYTRRKGIASLDLEPEEL